MLDLYQNEGIIAEPAGALSVAGLLEADIEPGSTVVRLISGGNDVSRLREVLSACWSTWASSTISWSTSRRSPVRCAGFRRRARTQRRYHLCSSNVKRNNRETGEALVGIELIGRGPDGLLARMRATDIHVEALEPGSPAYRYLL